MNCSTCGNILAPDARFCPRCGAHVTAQPLQPPPPYAGAPFSLPYTRVSRHLQITGILWLVYAFERTVSKLVGLLVLHGIFGNHFHPGWDTPLGHIGVFDVGVFWPIIVASVFVGLVLSLLTGYALLTRQPWGRIFAIVVSVLALFHPFFGTAIGIYTLWVLAPRLSGIEYDAIARTPQRA